MYVRMDNRAAGHKTANGNERYKSQQTRHTTLFSLRLVIYIASNSPFVHVQIRLQAEMQSQNGINFFYNYGKKKKKYFFMLFWKAWAKF